MKTNFVQGMTAVIMAAALSGCATAASPVPGSLFMDVKGPGMATTAFGPTAKGEACATSILGVYSTGDASIETAKKAGGILQVVSVDHTSNALLGIFSKYCTIVYGKGGGRAAAKPAAGGGGDTL